ncbi:hypothetical protein CsSME_00040064 [Camellia sinensis var. sinensis]
MIFERLQKEFEAARAAQTQEICLDGEQWNDGLLATIRERVHMEVERKAMQGDANILPGLHFHEKITYKVGTKVSITLVDLAKRFPYSSHLYHIFQRIYLYLFSKILRLINMSKQLLLAA